MPLSPESAAAITEAQDAYRQAEESGDPTALAAALTAAITAISPVFAQPLDTRVADIDATLGRALAADTPEDVLAALEQTPTMLPRLHARARAAGQPATQAAGQRLPTPVLWRDMGKPDDTGHVVLSAGEIAVLSGAGGLGKSTITLQLAAAAAKADGDHGAACGLRVSSGPVALLSYEDSPARIAQRFKWWGDVPARVRVWEESAPLWEADPGKRGASRSAAWWADWWAGIRARRTVLTIIDPVSVALANVSTSEPGPVRAFLGALAAEARRAQCGVLLVAHSTKAGRDLARQGEDPGAGIIAGSAAWYDGARGVLSLTKESTPDGQSQTRKLRCEKANYGPSGWEISLVGQSGPGSSWQGFKVARRTGRNGAAPAPSSATGTYDMTGAFGPE